MESKGNRDDPDKFLPNHYPQRSKPIPVEGCDVPFKGFKVSITDTRWGKGARGFGYPGFRNPCGPDALGRR